VEATAFAAEPIFVVGQSDGKLFFLLDPAAHTAPAMWGVVLADIVSHVANLYVAQGYDPSAVARNVVETFLAERQHPTGRSVKINVPGAGGLS
jgi:hypothetical protein